ncbi:MAG: hypothetical protein MI867_17745 [Pseudomonadales bacterium]|nr:hypothetical protein [Pseudomonadales bacterium]
MFKKLLLLIIGGAAAYGGFWYYTNLPQGESDALAEKLSEQKINLENIAKDIAESEVVQKAISKGKEQLEEHLMEAPQTKEWLAKMVQGYAQEFQGKELTEEASAEIVDVLVEVRQFSEDAMKEQAAGAEPYNPEQQRRFEQIMTDGDVVFQQHLGVSLTEFLAKINKSSFQQVVDP